jgi:hypothetical protein
MAQAKKITKRTKIALWLLIAPTAMIIAGLLLFALASWILSYNDLLGSNALTVTLNILLYFISLIGILTWLPGLIIGIVLLATPPTKKK